VVVDVAGPVVVVDSTGGISMLTTSPEVLLVGVSAATHGAETMARFSMGPEASSAMRVVTNRREDSPGSNT
jgi:hypothetical protein